MKRKPDGAWSRWAHDRLVAVEATGHGAKAPEQSQRTGSQIGLAVTGPRSRQVRGSQQSCRALMRSGAIATPSRNGRELLYQAGDIGAENVDASTPRLSAKSWPLPTLSGVMSSWSTNHVYGWIFRPLGIAAIHIEDLSLMGLSRDRWRKSAHVHLVPARQVRGVSQQGRRPASRR